MLETKMLNILTTIGVNYDCQLGSIQGNVFVCPNECTAALVGQTKKIFLKRQYQQLARQSTPCRAQGIIILYL